MLSEFEQVNRQERDLYGGLGIDGRNGRMGLEEIGMNAGNSVDSSQDRDY